MPRIDQGCDDDQRQAEAEEENRDLGGVGALLARGAAHPSCAEERHGLAGPVDAPQGTAGTHHEAPDEQCRAGRVEADRDRPGDACADGQADRRGGEDRPADDRPEGDR